MTDFSEMKKAYLNAIGFQDADELTEENTRLKHELEALQTRFDRVIHSLQDSIDSVLRVAREGKSD